MSSVSLRASAALAAVVSFLALSGCASGTGGLSSDPAEYGAPQAEMTVRSFLDAAAAEDYIEMSQQFGTRQGPAEARMGVTEVEQRMMVLAGMLRHRSYELREADLAQVGPNRTRFVAALAGTRYGNVSVPIIAVESRDGRWFVEQVDVEPLSRPGGP